MYSGVGGWGWGDMRWDGVLGGSGGQEVWMCNVRMGTGIELAHVTI